MTTTATAATTSLGEKEKIAMLLRQPDGATKFDWSMTNLSGQTNRFSLNQESAPSGLSSTIEFIKISCKQFDMAILRQLTSRTTRIGAS